MPIIGMKWSEKMQNLYTESVVLPVRPKGETLALGYTIAQVREIINCGRADFTEGHDDLSADDLVSLYCYGNMRRHFFESLATFRLYKATIEPMFCSGKRGLMIDVGCGPGTAGLALGECLRNPSLSYLGMDIAPAMTRKAKALLNLAIEQAILPEDTKLGFVSSWKRLLENVGKVLLPSVLINSTFLFASDSLDIDDVCSLVTTVQASKQVKRLLMTYSNTTHDFSNAKYDAFKKKMKVKGEGANEKTIKYHKDLKYAHRYDPEETTYTHELIVFK